MLKAELERAYKELQEAHTSLKDEYNGLTRKVVNEAAKAAWEHDLCEEVEATLKKAGIPIHDTLVRVCRVEEEVYRIPVVKAARWGLLDSDTDKEAVLNEIALWDDLAQYLDSKSEKGKTEYVIEEAAC